MIYIVTFEIHKDCKIKNYVYHCESSNAKEACEKARCNWAHCRANIKLMGHQFHLHAVRSKLQDSALLRVVSWKNVEYKGPECMNAYICTDWRTWRVNGRNIYA